MATFSATSRRHLTERVHPDLIRLFTEVIKHVDCSVLGGIRTAQEQADNIAKGLSWTTRSKHLPQEVDGLAHAVDVAPYPQSWDDPHWRNDQILFAGFVLGVASQLSIAIRWGGDWNSNDDMRDENPAHEDLDHFELVSKP